MVAVRSTDETVCNAATQQPGIVINNNCIHYSDVCGRGPDCSLGGGKSGSHVEVVGTRGCAHFDDTDRDHQPTTMCHLVLGNNKYALVCKGPSHSSDGVEDDEDDDNNDEEVRSKLRHTAGAKWRHSLVFLQTDAFSPSGSGRPRHRRTAPSLSSGVLFGVLTRSPSSSSLSPSPLCRIRLLRSC